MVVGEFFPLPAGSGFELGEELSTWRGFSICAVTATGAAGEEGVRFQALVRQGSTLAFGEPMRHAVQALQRMRDQPGLPIARVRVAEVIEQGSRSQIVLVEERLDGFWPVESHRGGPVSWTWPEWRDSVRSVLGAVRDLHAARFAHGSLTEDHVLLSSKGRRAAIDRLAWETVHRCFEAGGAEDARTLERLQEAELDRLVELVGNWTDSFERSSHATDAPRQALALIRFCPAAQLLSYADRLADPSYRLPDEPEPSPLPEAETPSSAEPSPTEPSPAEPPPTEASGDSTAVGSRPDWSSEASSEPAVVSPPDDDATLFGASPREDGGSVADSWIPDAEPEPEVAAPAPVEPPPVEPPPVEPAPVEAPSVASPPVAEERFEAPAAPSPAAPSPAPPAPPAPSPTAPPVSAPVVAPVEVPAAPVHEDLGQFQTATFFELEIRGRALAWRDELSAVVDDAEVRLRRAGGDSVETVRILVDFLQAVEAEIAGPGSGAEGRHLVQLLLQHLRRCGVRVLPTDSLERTLDLNPDSIYGHSLYGVDCVFEFAEGEAPIRAGSLMEIRRHGLDLFGEILQRGEIVVSQGAKPRGLDRLEAFLRSHSGHALGPDVAHVRDELFREFAQLQKPSKDAVPGFQDAVLRLADHLPRHPGGAADGEDEYAELRIGMADLMRWAGYEVDPPFDGHLVTASWSMPLEAVVPEFSESPIGTVIYANRIGLRRRGAVIKEGRVRVSIGRRAAGVEELRSGLEQVRPDAAMPLLRAIDLLEETVRDQRLAGIGLSDTAPEWSEELAMALVEGVSSVREAVASVEAFDRLCDALEELLAVTDTKGVLRFIPPLRGDLPADAAARPDLYEVVEEQDDFQVEAYATLVPRQFGCWFGGEVLRRCQARQINGRRSQVRQWVERARSILAGAGRDVAATAAVPTAAESWGLSVAAERSERREQLVEGLLELLSQLEVAAREGADTGVAARSWQEQVASVLEIELLPSPGASLDADLEQRLLDGAEQVESRFDLQVEAGRLIEVQRPGVWDAARSSWLRAPQVVQSRGPDPEAAELSTDLVQCLGSDPRLQQLARGVADVDRQVLVDLIVAVAECAADPSLGETAYAARGRALAALRGKLEDRGLEFAAPPAEIVPGSRHDGFTIEVAVIDEASRPTDLLCPRIVDSANGADIVSGRLVVRVLRPQLLSFLAGGNALKSLPGVAPWMASLEAGLAERGEAPRDRELIVQLFELLPDQLDAAAVGELRDAVTLVGHRLLGDANSAPLEGLQPDEFEAVERVAADDPAGQPIALHRFGLASRKRVVAPAKVVVSRGPGGPVVDQLEALEDLVRDGVAQRQLWSDDQDSTREFVEQVRERLRADPVRGGKDPRLLTEIYDQFVRCALTALDGAFLERVEACLEANLVARRNAGESVENDIDKAPAAFRRRSLPAVQGLGWQRLVVRAAILDSAGEVLQHGEVWEVGSREAPLGAELAAVLVALREEQGVGAFARDLVRNLSLVSDSDHDARDRVAVEVVHAIVQRGVDGQFDRRRVRELCRGVKNGYLEGRGWFETRIAVGEDLNRYLPRLAQLAPGASSQGTVTQVVLPGFSTRDGHQVLVPAIVQ